MESVMTRPKVFPKDCMVCGLLCLAAVTILPVIAVLIFTFRTAVIAGAAALLVVGCGLCAFNSRFRNWLREESAEEIRHRGLRLDQNAYLSPQHSWALLYRSVVVGVDDMLQAALGPIDEVELPTQGTLVRRGEPLFVLRHGDRRIEVASPISGTVLACNEDVRANPALINERPFHEGWVVRLQSEDLARERDTLLHGKEARAWFREEVDGLYEHLKPVPARSGEPAPAALPTEQIHRRIDDFAWRDLESKLGAHHPASPA